MTEFERDLVHTFNKYFASSDIKGIAYRLKQHKFASQLCDFLVDSPNKEFYLAIENKSINLSSSKKLYFTQHFSEADGTHQINRISDFLNKSGRMGFLALELKRGKGKSRKGFLIPWKEIQTKFEEKGVKGINLNSRESFIEVPRKGSNYILSKEVILKMNELT